jgi:hypothetical protein
LLTFVIKEKRMKKFWLVLLSLGLVMAFSVSAFAVDVKVSGEYYAAGLYLNKIGVSDEDTYATVDNKEIPVLSDPSTAFYYQRLRVGTDFIVSPCLKLVTRFDAMERIWGGARSDAGTTLAADSAGTRAENQNIAVDWAYINYVAPVGTFDVGYMNSGATGTIFGNSAVPAGRIKYYSPLIKDAININADITKSTDKSYSAVPPTTSATDTDKDAYAIEGVYNFKNDKAAGKAGLKIVYTRDATTKPETLGNYKSTYFTFTPWAIAKVGPVALQAELNWATGDYSKYDQPTIGPKPADVALDNLSAFIDATATFAPVYVGGTVAYVSGNDPATDKQEGGTLKGGNDWNPCLIMFNYYDVANWVGTVYGYDSTKVTGPMTNAWFFQGRAGIKPTPQWDAMLSVSYAMTDKKPSSFNNGTYGTEVDLTGTYKITNNLSYMLGLGYLFTGDYYKGHDHNSNNEVQDDFIVINKLTLSF